MKRMKKAPDKNYLSSRLSGKDVPIGDHHDHITHSNINSSRLISFTNSCGPDSSLEAVYHHVQHIKPYMFLITETQNSPNWLTYYIETTHEWHTSCRRYGGDDAYLGHDLPYSRFPLFEYLSETIDITFWNHATTSEDIAVSSFNVHKKNWIFQNYKEELQKEFK